MDFQASANESGRSVIMQSVNIHPSSPAVSGTVLGAGMVFERDTKPASGWRLWLTCPGSLLYVAKITHGYILSVWGQGAWCCGCPSSSVASGRNLNIHKEITFKKTH